MRIKYVVMYYGMVCGKAVHLVRLANGKLVTSEQAVKMGIAAWKRRGG